jgi:hypothetical protein
MLEQQLLPVWRQHYCSMQLSAQWFSYGFTCSEQLVNKLCVRWSLQHTRRQTQLGVSVKIAAYL